jgi:ATP-dependent DNA helicase PIF1
LDKTRLGKPDFEALHIFKQCCWPTDGEDSIKPTKLYSSRALVDQENTREFDKLTTTIHEYKAIDWQPSSDDCEGRNMLDKLQAGQNLRLRIGAQVMLVANLSVSEGLVNGSRGIVVGFVSLAQATSQLENQGGLRGDDESRDLAIFARGEEVKFPQVLFKVRNVPKLVHLFKLPLIQAIITPYKWKVALDYRLDAYRIQIPLISAWALTIHKCQGMTLEKCEVNLNHCFGFGMAYVALSRSKSREGLQIVGWKGGKEIRADPVVEAFYKDIKARV